MNEIERRQHKLDQVEQAYELDALYRASWERNLADRAERRVEALQLLEALKQDSNAGAFRAAMQAWSSRAGYEAFSGFAQMFVNQIVNYTNEAASTAELLVEVFAVPADEADAAAKLRKLLALVESIKRGAHPAAGRVPFVVSLFWSLQDPIGWPVMWPSAEKKLRDLGWLTPAPDVDQGYLAYRSLVRSFTQTPVEVEGLLYWMEQRNPFIGIDSTIVERCRENAELRARGAGSGYNSAEDASKAELNARAILGELKIAAAALEERVDSALGRDVTARLAKLTYRGDLFRADGYVAWTLENSQQLPGFRIWATTEGVAIGLHPGWRDEGWIDRVGRELVDSLPAGVEFLRTGYNPDARIDPTGRQFEGGAFLVGSWIPGNEALDRADLADKIETVARTVRPVFERILATVQGRAEVPGDWLGDLVREFRQTNGYPTDKDETSLADRKEFAAALTPEALQGFDLTTFRQIINTQRYGGPGPQAILNSTLTNASPEDLERLAEAISYLLWNEDESLAHRLDRFLDKDDKGLKGLGGSVAMKLLAISHPDKILPIFPYNTDNGKKPMMDRLGIPALDDKSLTRGERQTQSNDAIRDRLRDYFPGDLLEMGRFLWWLRSRTTVAADETQDLIDPLQGLAAELLVDESFLQGVVELLEEKGQVVFYGPPGTGKTYIARALAKALVSDANRRPIVQFHPSMSYEDFFEGYRPDADDSGQLSYSIVPGPLARIAALAEADPSVRHILVIDEINRANLPKVLGELLYLLEYRDEPVLTLYRPDEPFSLPKNLWLIGTMNTADRSIALVDAALRRRFYFVPFFPEQDQMEGLLKRWLQAHNGDVRIAHLVEQVNLELAEQVGDHLQLGPSYFMREGLDDKQLRRVWKYSVEPYIEEQLFGQPHEIAQFRFEKVRERYWQTLSGVHEGSGESAGGATDDPESGIAPA